MSYFAQLVAAGVLVVVVPVGLAVYEVADELASWWHDGRG